MKRILTTIAGLMIVFALGWVALAETASEAFQRAETAYEKKNYKEAAEAYEAVLKADPDFPKKTQAGYRLIFCWKHLGEWKKSESAVETFVKTHKDTLWEARGLALHAAVMWTLPHYGSKKGEELIRGEHRRGWTYTNTQNEDYTKAVDLAEQSRLLFAKYLKDPKGLSDEDRKTLPDEAIAVNFDLAQYLIRQNNQYGWWGHHRMAAAPALPTPDAENYEDIKKQREAFFKLLESYDSKADVRKRVIFLLDEVVGLDGTEKKDIAALAIYRKAMYLKSIWQEQMPETHDTIALLQKVVGEFKASPAAPDALYSLGLVYRDRGRFVEAVKTFGEVPVTYPKCEWVNDAKHQAELIKRPSINLNALGPKMPGDPVELTVHSRSVPEIKFTAYSVKLEDVIADIKGHDPRHGWDRYYDAIWRGDRVERFKGPQVATWSAKTTDAADYKPVNDKVTAPLENMGAYFIVAEGEGVEARQMVVISDLAIARVRGRGENHFYVANAVTGEPVEGVDMTVEETWWHNRSYRRHVEKIKSGELGLYQYVAKHTSSSNIQAFAFAGSRYAMTHHSWSYGRNSNEQRTYKAYLTTNRPIYRPGHTVHFKVSVRGFYKGEYEMPGDADVRAIIRDAKGNEVYKRTLKLSGQGSINDKFVLSADAPLGMYNLRVDSPSLAKAKKGYLRGYINFRVEEYKKPEFEVTVAPEATQAKMGEKVKAKIQAKYYFGAPVTDAKVSYRVFRTPYYHHYQPAGRYDWLYGGGYGKCFYPMPYWGGRWRHYGRPAGGRELIKEGTVDIGEDGAIDVEFDTADLAQRFPDQDHRFQIEAEVVDASRRTITGSGAVTVTRNQFYVFLEAQNGFYRPGDKVKLEVKATTPDGKPVATKGTLLIAKVTYKGEKNDQIEEAKIIERAFETDAEGRGFAEETLDESGQYKFTFKTEDDWKQEVTGSAFVWLRDENFDARTFRFRDIELITDKRSYEEGEVAHVMVNANYADAWVLLFQDVGGDIAQFNVLHLPAKSKVFDIPVEKKHLPNFFLNAVMLRNGNVFRETREIFAPPANQFLELSVSSDKPQYQPGEKGTFTFEARDNKGQPVQAELAFSLFDSSILYFQPELAQEIKQFYFGQRRYSSVNIDGSNQVSFGSQVKKQPPLTEYKDLQGQPPEYQGVWWGLEAEQLGQKEFAANRQGGLRAAAPPGAPAADGITDAAKKAKQESQSLEKNLNALSESKDRAEGGRENLRRADKAGAEGKADGRALEGGSLKEAEVRSNFADSAAWAPTLLTGADGKATLEVTFPDSLTTWTGNVYGGTTTTQVGSTNTSVVTTKNLLVRLQAPRFFVERDEVVLSANIHNYLSTAKKVKAEIVMPSDVLACDQPLTLDVEVPAGGEMRLDWTVKVLKEGQPSVLVKALTDEESDAMTLTFPALVHGTEKFVADAGQFRPDQMGAREITFNVPADRKPEASELRVTMSPSLAGAMLDALPYLIDYPYGCCEQTMSRFLPAVVAQATLKDLGVNLEDLEQKRKQLSAKELERIGYLKSPVFDSSKLDSIVKAGMRRLYGFQNGDGGWGWWKQDRSSVNMTAYVLYGLNTAKAAGVPGLDENRRQRGMNYLQQVVSNVHKIKEEKDRPWWNRGGELEPYAYGLYVLSMENRTDKKALDHIWTKRDDLNAYGKALLALTLNELKDPRAKTAYENLMQYIKEDAENGTAWIKVPETRSWYWYNNGIESNAWTLKAMAKLDPKSDLGPKLTKYLLNQRKGHRWYSTKDTAMTLYAMADYMKASGETDPEYTVTVDFDGMAEKKVTVTKDNFFTFDNQFVIKGTDIPDGARKVTIKKDGPGALYYTAQLKYFSKEADIKGAGFQIEVTRDYYKLTPKQEVKKVKNAKGEEVEIKELRWDRTKLEMGAVVESGDQIEVELTIKAPNDYEYILIEDPKAAGCEPVDLTSGSRYGNGLCSNMELRDTQVVFFITWLGKGEHTLKYKLRAEIPGTFHALPTKVNAMYSPDVRAISDEMRLGIKDKGEHKTK